MRYFYCRKCQVLIPETEVDQSEGGPPIHPMTAAGYDLPLFHEVIPEP